MPRLIVLFLAFALAPAQASTPSAWAALDRAARNDCSRAIVKLASRARIARFSGRISGLGGQGDEDRYYGLLASGSVAGGAVQWLCLYDKRARTVTAREIERP